MSVLKRIVARLEEAAPSAKSILKNTQSLRAFFEPIMGEPDSSRNDGVLSSFAFPSFLQAQSVRLAQEPCLQDSR